MSHRAVRAVLALCLLLAGIHAQQPDPAGPLDVLRDRLFQARTAVSLLRTGDFRLREELTRELDAVQRALDWPRESGPQAAPRDAAALRALGDRIDAARRRARSGESVTGQGLGPTAVAAAGVRDLQPLDVPAGTQAVVRLLQAVDLDTPDDGAVIEAATVEPVTSEGRGIAPAGALIQGVVARQGSQATLVFDRIQIGYTTWVLKAVPAEAPAGRLRAGSLLRLTLHPPDPLTAPR